MLEPQSCVQKVVCVSSVPNGDSCVDTYADAGTLCDDGLDSTKGDVCDGASVCAGNLRMPHHYDMYDGIHPRWRRLRGHLRAGRNSL